MGKKDNSAPLLTPKLLKNLTESRIPQELSRLVRLASKKKLPGLLDQILAIPRTQRHIPAFIKNIEEIGDSYVYNFYYNDRCLEYFQAIFRNQSSNLNIFVTARDSFEKAILENRLKDAEIILEELLKTHGESIWWVKAKLLLLFSTGKPDEMQTFCQRLKDRCTGKMFSYHVSNLIVTTQSGNSHSSLQKFVYRAIEEFQTAKEDNLVWLINIIYSPERLYLCDLKLEHLYLLQTFPAVDQYSLVTNFAISALSDERLLDPAKQQLLKLLTETSETIKDDLVNNFLSHIKSKNTAASCELSKIIISLYESGNYKETIELYKNNIRTIESPISLLNIIAKSTIYCGKPYETGLPIIDSTVKNLQEIYKLSSRATRAIAEILDQTVRFHGTKISLDLQSVLAVAVPQSLSEQALKKSIALSSFRQRTIFPLQRSMLEAGKKIYTKPYAFEAQTTIPSQRLIRCGMSEVASHEIIDHLSSLCESEYVLKDLIDYKSRLLYSAGMISELIEIASDYLSKYPESYLCFPMKELADHIESNFICTLDSIIVVHYYVKFISESKRTTLNELFEEFLFLANVEKPSDIVAPLLANRTGKHFLFFYDICVFENLDFLAAFQSSDELRSERIKIIEYLYNTKLISKDMYSNELEQIVRQVVLDSATSSFSRSKIFVDQDALTRKIFEEANTLFELYKIHSELAGDDSEGVVILNSDPDDESVATGLLHGRSNSLLQKILELTRDTFLFDETFGLDSNLSAEIRHGIFSNFIRSEVEAKKLITEKNENGTYRKNPHWQEFYSDFIVADLVDALDREFAWFSERFNSLVEEAEGWMKISTTIDNTVPAFLYTYDLNEFNALKNTALSSNHVEDFLDEVFKTLWTKTQDGLSSLKEKINDDFKTTVDNLFDELSNRIIDVKRNAVLTELMNSIDSAKNDTREIIREISEWFSRSENKTFDSQKLSQLIDISISCFNKIKGYSPNITRSTTIDSADFEVSGTVVNSFILGMINIFTNCIRHSGLDKNVEIKIHAERVNTGFYVEITNNLSETKINELDDYFFSTINSNFASPDSLELMRREGGTGLAKAFHHLRSASQGFDIKVALKDSQFSAKVIYETLDLVS